jgi:hypothetical protein
MSGGDQKFIGARANPQSSIAKSQRSVRINEYLIALVFALLLSLVVLVYHPQAALASYSCGNVSSGHCYARVYWSRSTSGAYVNIQVVSLYCNPQLCYGSNGVNQEIGFVDNEMWFSQGSSYWVEAGYSTYNTSNFETHNSYYWADLRPGYAYAEHEIAQVPAGDYGGNVSIEIEQGSGNTYDVFFGSNTWGYTGYSTSNTMSPNTIWEGEELAGTGGASAPTAAFTSSQWLNGSTWVYQTTSGTVQVTNSSVGNGYWSVPPNGSNQGGVWDDYCCQGH